MNYRNFDIEIYEYKQRTDIETYNVRVTNSPAGDQSPSQAELIVLPSDLRVVTAKNFLTRPQSTDMIEMGEGLANCILPSSIRQLFLESIRLLKEDEALRLRLKFDAWQLANLPWEYIYLSKSTHSGASKDIDGFCALDRRISMARYEYSDYPLIPLQPGEGVALRQLVLMSSPTDFPLLNFKEESKDISESLRSISNLTIDYLTNPTLENVLELLSRSTHLFHFTGHGGFGQFDERSEGSGGIVLCRPDGTGILFSAEKLALNLARCGIRVAILNCGKSAVRNSTDRYSGVAPALVRGGIPAVVGLNGPISDKSAIILSRQIYRTLAAGNPIDTAITNSRLALFNEDNGFEWGLPVFYLRTEESTIFPINPKSTQTINRKLSVTSRFTLRNMLVKHFSIDELRLLCADITDALNRDGIQQRVDLEIVGGDNLETYVLNLIQHLERRGLLNYLVDIAMEQRPNYFEMSKDEERH